MRELWIAVAEVLTEPSVGNRDTHAFTNVVTWASTSSDYVDSVTAVFAEFGWTVLGTENERPVASETGFSEEITEIIERAAESKSLHLCDVPLLSVQAVLACEKQANG